MQITRRRLLEGSAVAALSGSRALAAGAKPPNIVFVLADDLGYADLGCFGARDIRTPNIDRIAARGVRLVQGYASSAVCSATRTALITGRYQYRLPIGLEEPFAGTGSPRVGLPPDHATLPSLLRAAGYRTALVGKWHLGQLPEFGPLKSGYDQFWGFRLGAVDYFSHASAGPDLWDGDTPIAQAGYLTDLLAARAEQVIDGYAAGTAPFFLSLHFNAPHWPWEARGDEAESRRIAGRLVDLDGGSRAKYAEMVEQMDEGVGRVLAALDRHGITDDTIVVFTSDNGGERFSMNWPFSGRKEELLEGGVRVPVAASWPARWPKGATSQQVAATIDWLPTLLAAAGATPDPRTPPDGIDLGPHLLGGAQVARTLYWRYKAHAQRAVRDGTLKYLKIDGNEFLFDVVADPLERANLKARQPADFARLKALWRAWNATMLPENPDSYTEGVSAAIQADHIGAQPVDRRAVDAGD